MGRNYNTRRFQNRIYAPSLLGRAGWMSSVKRGCIYQCNLAAREDKKNDPLIFVIFEARESPPLNNNKELRWRSFSQNDEFGEQGN